MTWEMLNSIIKSWTNVRDERPFVQLQAKELLEGSKESLNLTIPDLETATLALLELRMRSSSRAQGAAKEIECAIQDVGHQPINWLMQARKNLQLLKYKEMPNDQYTNSIYVILRDGYTEQNGRYGLYVGETSKTVGERFKQHLNGIDAGRGLPEHGMQLMYSLMWPWQKVPGAKRLFYEAALHKALELNNINGPKISGNAEAVEKWPEGFQTTLQKKL